MKTMNPITPGEILLEEYLKPLGISQNLLGSSLGISQNVINEVALGQSSITPEISTALGKFFDQSPRFWLGIQTNCDS